MDGARAAGAGDVEGLGDDARDVVGLAHQVVVLRHRQRDAGDVDLLEGVLADERAGHVAGDGDHGHGVQLGGGDAGHEVGGAGAAGAEADADLAAGAGVAVGRMGGALLVADEDGAQLGMVGPDVVEGQDDAARVAEDDLHALADERLAERVRADARAVQWLAVAEHVAAGLLDGLCLRCPEGRHVAAAAGCGGAAVAVAAGAAASSVSSTRPRGRSPVGPSAGPGEPRWAGSPVVFSVVIAAALPCLRCPLLAVVLRPARSSEPVSDITKTLAVPDEGPGGSTSVAPCGAISACPQTPAGSR